MIMKQMGLAEKKKEMNMQRVMHDALHYFEKNGYYNTSIDKLCKGAMISRSSFFNYFGCKEKIIELIVADGLKDYKEFVYKEMEDPKDPVESLRSCIDFHIRATVKYKNVTSVAYQMAMDNENFKMLNREYIDVTEYAIGRVKELGSYTDKYPARWIATLILGKCVHAFMSMKVEECREEIMDTVDRLLEMMK